MVKPVKHESSNISLSRFNRHRRCPPHRGVAAGRRGPQGRGPLGPTVLIHYGLAQSATPGLVALTSPGTAGGDGPAAIGPFDY